ncbi:MAG: metalloregulator ArsR/SmtB family transcription factor [Erysipelotrichaceae bacterium]|nr:metalloregulator ArsR/SmtB family transcription factor [Erysipelotrichaceae bacterium]
MDKEKFLNDCDVIHADIVELVAKQMSTVLDLHNLSEFYKILGDKTRISIICALDKHEMCVCDLGILLGMTKSAISHQLRVLRQANLVKNRRDGKVIFYSLADDHVKRLFEIGLEHVQEAE